MNFSRVRAFEGAADDTVLAYYTPRGGVPDHYHRRCHELLYVAGGAGWCRLGQDALEVRQDSLLVLPAGARHQVSDDPRAPLSVFVLAFKEEALGGLPDSDRLLSPVHSGPRRVQIPDSLLREVHLLMRRLAREAARPHDDWPLASRIHLMQLLLTLARGQKRLEAGPAADPRVYQLKDYIDEHFSEPLDVESLSRMVQLSPRQVTNLFKRDMGVTVADYINRVRLDRARSLLVETRLDVAAVCFESGFQSLPQFYRAFKEMTGVPPGRYRRVPR